MSAHRSPAKAAALLAVLASSLLAGAATSYGGARWRAIAFRDVAHDANGINSQGETGVGRIDVPTDPATLPAGDLLRVFLRPEERGGPRPRVTAFTVTLVLGGPPADDIDYWVHGEVPGHCNYVAIGRYRSLEGSTASESPTTTELGAPCGGFSEGVKLRDAVVRGNRLTIRVPLRVLPPEIRPGDRLERIWAWTKLGAVLDSASTPKKFRIR